MIRDTPIRAIVCVVVLQTLYIISTIGYTYRRKFERMREPDKNDIHVSFTNYLCQFLRTLPHSVGAKGGHLGAVPPLAVINAPPTTGHYFIYFPDNDRRSIHYLRKRIRATHVKKN